MDLSRFPSQGKWRLHHCRENERWLSTYAITDLDPPILISVSETDAHLGHHDD